MPDNKQNSIPIDTDTDRVTETVKVTQGYFTNGDGTLEGVNIYTMSLSDSNEGYYFNVSQAHPSSSAAATQFSVTYGHMDGSGSDATGDTGVPSGLKSETQAVYRQFANLLLDSAEVSSSFKISAQGGDSPAAAVQDKEIYILVGRRERMKDKMNKKSWTLRLSGSKANDTAADLLTLTDDSFTKAAASTPAGPRYNIVSGSAGNVVSASTEKTYGWFYPEMGAMVFSGAELGGYIPGKTAGKSSVATFASEEHLGFDPNVSSVANAKNALRLVNCMRNVGAGVTLRLRSEEDQTQIHYFCRVKAPELNHSNNPTFVSGSDNTIRNTDMRGNPQVFISTVGLWNDTGELVAIAKLSSPLKKNFSSESTIKIKLTY